MGNKNPFEEFKEQREWQQQQVGWEWGNIYETHTQHSRISAATQPDLQRVLWKRKETKKKKSLLKAWLNRARTKFAELAEGSLFFLFSMLGALTLAQAIGCIEMSLGDF